MLLSTFVSILLNSYGQNSREYQIIQKSKQGIPTFIQFDENTGINHLNFQEKLKDEFNFSEENQLALNSESADKLGFTHYKYNQSYKGISVFGATYIIHEKDNHVKTANGKFFPIMNINITPIITKEDAIQKAKEQLNISVCRWESKTEEDKLKSKHKNPNAIYYPKPILEIVAKEGNITNPNFRLAWKFNISGMSMDKAWTVFIDAETGELIYKNSLVANDVIGTTTTYYNGTQNINCSFDSVSGYYLLAENNRGASANQAIYTLTANNDTLPPSGNVWNSMQYIGSTTASFTDDAVAGSAHWGIEQAYDFYTQFGRNSFDNNGTYILNLVHYGTGHNNAFWSNYDTVMCYGDGDGSFMDYVVGLDVTGHEFTHAITSYSANLQYEAESGALNESFSDIFGTGIEWYVLGPNSNWSIGEDVMITANALRSMNNPLLYQQPNTYLGINWGNTSDVSEANDNGGVHTNSGVQNYWFYLLAAGGSGTNDNGDDYFVNGLGMSDALNIAYRNLTEYLTPTSDYNDAMVGSIQSAIDLWGDASPQVQAVKDAWCAVGVLDCSNVGIKENSSVIQCEVSPNPSDGVFTFKVSPQFKAAQLRVQDMVGRTMYIQATDSTQTIIDLSAFPTGIYTLSVKSHNQTISKKIVVQ